MEKSPRILRVETGLISLNTESSLSGGMLDYSVYNRIPHVWRGIEQKLRLDFYLAWRARQVESQHDMVWAGSEKVGIPYSFMNPKKPMIVIGHNLQSPEKAKFLQATGIAKKWAGIGYISDEGRKFLVDTLGVHPDRLFQYESAKHLDKLDPTKLATNGPITAAGVAKRDYPTLISALAGLPGYETELFVSSKFGDELAGSIRVAVPEWVKFTGFIPEDELVERYHRTRFVVVPLEETTHTGAGINVVLEAGAFCKAVIATKTGGMPTFVKHGETGFLVPPNDPEALRDAICRLWTDPDLANRMGLANRRFVESRYNPKKVNLDIATFLDRIYMDSQRKKGEQNSNPALPF